MTQAFLRGARFILRWPKNYQLLDEYEQLKKPGELSKAKRAWDHRLVWDARRRCERKVGIIAFPVFDHTHHQPLWLVVARRKGESPWYLLTSESAYSPELAWKIVFAYARRWQIEMALRYNKSELAFESPRLLQWDARLKLLSITGLVYAFLLSLLHPALFLNCVPGSCIRFAIVPASGARSLRLRFIVYVLLFLFFGFLIPRPSSPFYEIRDASCFLYPLLCFIPVSTYHQ